MSVSSNHSSLMFIWFLLSSSFLSIVSVSPLLIHLSSFLHLPSVFTQHWKGEVGMSMLEQDCAKDFAWRLSPSLFDFSSFLLRTNLLFSGTITTSSLTSLTCFTVWLQLHHTVNMWTVNAVMVDFMVTSAPFLSPHWSEFIFSLTYHLSSLTSDRCYLFCRLAHGAGFRLGCSRLCIPVLCRVALVKRNLWALEKTYIAQLCNTLRTSMTFFCYSWKGFKSVNLCHRFGHIIRFEVLPRFKILLQRHNYYIIAISNNFCPVKEPVWWLDGSWCTSWCLHVESLWHVISPCPGTDTASCDRPVWRPSGWT